ncbi:putative sulfate exporter family transporter [Brachybacterium sp. JHP9]|uniref:Sulfate exporter family transporter n=1 Tax=Brachybacterium equifaecis TaxID=2910770 RepID=A0ABT0QYE5_9MICO|nr:putative sulfate exporter family transporter [Brachybacterium equifaecis]
MSATGARTGVRPPVRPVRSAPLSSDPRTGQSVPDPDEAPAARLPRASSGWTLLGIVVVLAPAAGVQVLVRAVPAAAEATAFAGVARSIEFPIYAILLGFAGNGVLSLLGWRQRMAAAFRTELFIKTGLVLLGASINAAIVLRAIGPALVQAVLLIAMVFSFTWWFAGRLGVDDRLRALLASALSICGVSAAVAAAGAVQARKEQLAFTATLVIVFAVPSIFLLPWLADLMGLSPAVTGAWIGGNIDTTAAVTAAGTVAGEEALQIAAIVKTTQNALLGVVAVLLTMYFAFRAAPGAAPSPPTSRRAVLRTVRERFPKFVLGFLAASVLVTILRETMPSGVLDPRLDAIKSLQTWAFTLAFVCIGLEFKVSAAREAGWRPVLVFAAATAVNLLGGLLLAALLFSGFAF